MGDVKKGSLENLILPGLHGLTTYHGDYDDKDDDDDNGQLHPGGSQRH